MLEVKQLISFYSNGYLFYFLRGTLMDIFTKKKVVQIKPPVQSQLMCAIIRSKEQAVDWFVDDSNTNLNENRK